MAGEMEEIDMNVGGGADEDSQETGEESNDEFSENTQDSKGKDLAKVNIFGEEEDLPPIEEMKRDYQKYRAAQKMFQEASQIKKQMQSFIREIKKNPDILSDPRLGIDLDNYAEQRMLRKLQDRMLSPEEKEKLTLKEKLQSYEEREKKEKEREATIEHQERVQRQRGEISEVIDKALSGTDIEKDAYALRTGAVFLKSCLQQGYWPDPEEIKEYVEGRVMKDYGAALRKLRGPALLKFLGDEGLKEIRKADLQRLTGRLQEQRPIPKMTEGGGRKEPEKLDRWALQEKVNRWAES